MALLCGGPCVHALTSGIGASSTAFVAAGSSATAGGGGSSLFSAAARGEAAVVMLDFLDVVLRTRGGRTAGAAHAAGELHTFDEAAAEAEMSVAPVLMRAAEPAPLLAFCALSAGLGAELPATVRLPVVAT